MSVRPADAKAGMMNGGCLIHVHEDDWGMRALHPLAARDEVRADLVEGIAASERNRDPSGHGWTAVHVMATPAVDFRGLIEVEGLRATLAPLMPTVTRFYATACAGFSGTHDIYGSYDEAAVCYGFDHGCYLKADVDGGQVEGIWFECWTENAVWRESLLAALRAIDVLTPCSLVDHWLHVEGVVGDREFLESYVDLLARPRRDL